MLARSRRFVLVALPLCLGLALWPVVRRYQERARARAVAEATPQLRAAIKRDLDEIAPLSVSVVAPLLQEGGDVNVHNNRTTALHCAAMKPWNVWHGASAHNAAVAAERLALARFLLAHGANVNARDGLDLTPLMVAAHHSRPQVVKALLESGADVNLYQAPNADPWSGEKLTASTALTIAREALKTLKAMSTPAPESQEYQQYKAEVSAAQQTIALLQATPVHPKRPTPLLTSP